MNSKKSLGVLSACVGLMMSAVFIGSGCASLRSVSVTQIPQDRSKPIEVEETNWGFLGIHFTNGFVDDLSDRLRMQCPNGKVSGIYTKYEAHFYFLLDRRKVTAKGFCMPAGNS